MRSIQVKIGNQKKMVFCILSSLKNMGHPRIQGKRDIVECKKACLNIATFATGLQQVGTDFIQKL